MSQFTKRNILYEPKPSKPSKRNRYDCTCDLYGGIAHAVYSLKTLEEHREAVAFRKDHHLKLPQLAQASTAHQNQHQEEETHANPRSQQTLRSQQSNPSVQQSNSSILSHITVVPLARSMHSRDLSTCAQSSYDSDPLCHKPRKRQKQVQNPPQLIDYIGQSPPRLPVLLAFEPLEADSNLSLIGHSPEPSQNPRSNNRYESNSTLLGEPIPCPEQSADKQHTDFAPQTLALFEASLAQLATASPPTSRSVRGIANWAQEIPFNPESVIGSTLSPELRNTDYTSGIRAPSPTEGHPYEQIYTLTDTQEPLSDIDDTPSSVNSFGSPVRGQIKKGFIREMPQSHLDSPSASGASSSSGDTDSHYSSDEPHSSDTSTHYSTHQPPLLQHLSILSLTSLANSPKNPHTAHANPPSSTHVETPDDPEIPTRLYIHTYDYSRPNGKRPPIPPDSTPLPFYHSQVTKLIFDSCSGLYSSTAYFNCYGGYQI